MKRLPTILVLSSAALLGACAGPMGSMSGSMPNRHMSHHFAMPAMQEGMEAMHVMRDKMNAARSPAERQALMDEHMKAMHAGMESMKTMDGKQGMARTPMDFAQHQQQMETRMDMMQTMMEMMMQRMPK